MPRVPASGAWFVKGALSPNQEVAFNAAMLQALQAISTDRQMVNRTIVKRMGLDLEVAKNVHLMI